MHTDYKELIERRFTVALSETGPDKRTSLKAAISRHVKPGMSVHIGSTTNRAYALAYELIRQYWRKDPGFEISCLNLGGTWAPLYASGIFRKGVTAFTGDVWPGPSPNPIINEAWRSGRVELENWSILSFVQRLLAGALRVPFLPTRSLVGSTMGEENERLGTFKEMDDPFGSGERVGLVAALRPDVCLLHVAACDTAGNAILTPPRGEGALGAFAARQGAIVSTERIVSTDTLREHSDLVQVPAERVLAVVEAPLGGHPHGVTNVGVREFDQYADDYPFLFGLRKASRQGPEAMDEWVQEWILSCEDHNAFVEKLGEQRVQRLREEAEAHAWHPGVQRAAKGEPGANERPGEMSTDTDRFRASEMMVVAGSRRIVALTTELKLTNVLAGIGSASLSAWLALQTLRDAGYPVEAMAEIGYFGYEPRPGDPYIFNFKNTPTCLATTDVFTVLGLMVGGGGCLGSVGAAQIDRTGNINTTRITDKLLLSGSGGGNDVASAARVVIVTASLGKEKFKEKIDYITSPGKNVRVVVTDRGIFEKQSADDELVLTGYYTSGPTGAASAEEAVEEIREGVGWDLRIREHLDAIPAPTSEELRLVRLFDPYRQFLR